MALLRLGIDGGRCTVQPMEAIWTEPQNEDPLSRANELENIVDELDEKVADEREAKGVPGRPSDRGRWTCVSENEPPD